jgi:hypothetical protein
MYGYYALAELGLINTAWGGKFITPIQLVQFVMCIAGVAYETIFYEKCGSSQAAVYWLNFTYLIFLIFFVKVYVDKARYRKTLRGKQAQEKQKKQ